MIQVGSNHLAKVLDQLEAMGYIARRMHVADRRRRLLDLTAEGFAVVDRAGPRIRDAQERLMGEAFTAGERRQLIQLATRLRRTLAEIVTPVVPPRPGPSALSRPPPNRAARSGGPATSRPARSSGAPSPHRV